jgi:ABC-2 type transport system permease protein
MFKNVILYDNKIEDVNATKLDNGKYQVDIDFTISKYTTDLRGNRMYSQTKNDSLTNDNSMNSVIGSLPLSDYIEFVVFGEEEVDGVITLVELYKKKHEITKIYNKLRINLNQKPTGVGVDPYHKLIDRNLEDNRKGL